MGFSRPCGLSRRCVGSWPFTDAALHVLRCAWLAPAGSKAFTSARSPPNRTGDFEDLTAARIGWAFLLNTTTPVVFPAASPVRLSLSALPQTALPLRDRLSAASLPPWGFPKIASPSVHPAGVHSQPLSGPSRRGLPPRSRATRLRSSLAVFTTSPAFSSCKLPGLHPAPILGFAAFPSDSALASSSFPAARFPPFEALLPAARCSPRSRDGCGGSSPPHRCRRGVHRTPSLLVLRSFRLRASGGNLEGFLVLRSRTPVHRFRCRSALAPLGLSIL